MSSATSRSALKLPEVDRRISNCTCNHSNGENALLSVDNPIFCIEDHFTKIGIHHAGWILMKQRMT